MSTKEKKCSLCKKIKSYDYYYIRPDGTPYSQCNHCKKISSKKWYENDMKNQEKYDVDGKICPKCNIFKCKNEYYVLKKNEKMSTYCIYCESLNDLNNPNRKISKQKWISNNKDQIRKSQLDYHHSTRKHDIQYKISQNLRSAMHRVLNKKNKTTELLSCDIEYFEKWIEFQFNNKMNWDNYGEYWEIDHTKPCASYNLEQHEEQFKCFNWTNLRPLEVEKNRSKRDKIIEIDIFKQKLNVIFFKRQHVQIAGTS